MIRLQLNQEYLEVPVGTSLATLLAEHAHTATPFAVAINCEFVPKSQYALRLLAANDQIELLTPVGGG